MSSAESKKITKPTKLRVCGYTPYTGEGGDTNDPLTAVTNFKLNFNLVRSTLKKNFKADVIDPAILRIFLAPEWVFRKPDTTMEVPDKTSGGKKKIPCHNYWSPREFGEILKGLVKLSKTDKSMLIVGGSILWAQPGRIVVDKKKGFTEGVAVVYNTTIVVCNGEIVHIYHKQHEGIDIDMKSDAHGNVFGMDPDKNNTGDVDYSWLHDAKSKYVATVDMDGKKIKPLVSNTFKFKGLKFGIEICIDHGNSVLKKGSGDGTVDVQIVVSCGMFLNKHAIVARKGGVAIHTDGGNKKGPSMKKTGFGFYKVDESGELIGSVGGPSNKVYGPDNKTFIGKAPHLSFVYDDVLELDWFKEKPKKRTKSVTGGKVSSAKQAKKKDTLKGKKKKERSGSIG